MLSLFFVQSNYLARVDSETRAVAESYLDAWNAHDFARLEDLLADESCRQSVRGFLELSEDARLEVKRLIVEDDTAAVLGEGTGTVSNPPPWLAHTQGKPWRARYVALYRVADGRIADLWVQWNMLSILIQTGAISNPLEPPVAMK